MAKKDRPQTKLVPKPSSIEGKEDLEKLDQLQGEARDARRDGEDEEKKRTTFYIPASLHRQLKAHAALNDQSMSELATQAIQEMLKQ